MHAAVTVSGVAGGPAESKVAALLAPTPPATVGSFDFRRRMQESLENLQASQSPQGVAAGAGEPRPFPAGNLQSARTVKAWTQTEPKAAGRPDPGKVHARKGDVVDRRVKAQDERTPATAKGEDRKSDSDGAQVSNKRASDATDSVPTQPLQVKGESAAPLVIAPQMPMADAVESPVKPAAKANADVSAEAEIASALPLKGPALVVATAGKSTKPVEKKSAGAAVVPVATPSDAGKGTEHVVALLKASDPAPARDLSPSSAVATAVPSLSIRQASEADSVVKTRDTTPVAAKAEDSSPAPITEMRTLAATPKVLEVGIASETHGWVRVRAELGQTGEIAASVAAASAGATEGLHRELAAISAYLAGEQVGVSSLVVHATDKGAGTQDAAMSQGQAMQRGADEDGQRRDRSQKTDGGVPWNAQAEAGVTVDVLTAVGVGAGLTGAVSMGRSGSWLSVRA